MTTDIPTQLKEITDNMSIDDKEILYNALKIIECILEHHQTVTQQDVSPLTQFFQKLQTSTILTTKR